MVPGTLRQRLHAALWRSTEEDGAPPRLRPGAVYPLLALVVLALGFNWPIMSTGLQSISALWMAALRLAGAAVTLFALTLATGRLSLPPRSDYPVVISVAIFRMALPFVLVFAALEIVPAGRSSILMWTQALWTVPLAAIFLGERMSPLRWFGLAAGIVGIILVFDPVRLDWSDGRVLLGHGMLIAAAISHAGVAVHVRRHRWTATPLALLPWQMLVGAIPILAIALGFEGIPDIHWTPRLVAIVAFEGVVAGGFAIWAQLTVLRSHSAIGTSLALMAVPVIGLLSSAILLRESLAPLVVAGLVLILIGVAMGRVARVPGDTVQ